MSKRESFIQAQVGKIRKILGIKGRVNRSKFYYFVIMAFRGRNTADFILHFTIHEKNRKIDDMQLSQFEERYIPSSLVRSAGKMK